LLRAWSTLVIPVAVLTAALVGAASASPAPSPVYRIDHVADGDTIDLATADQ
jgi:hypothetical protein